LGAILKAALSKAEPLPYRILIGPELPCSRLIDHDHLWPTLTVAIRETPAPYESNAKRI
jgi:hypothetical protein